MTNSTFIENLADQGYSVWPDFLSRKETDTYRIDLLSTYQAGKFVRAGVGKGNERVEADEIRRDEVFWFDSQAHKPNSTQAELLARVDDLKDQLNRELFLGLWSFEGHYARYQSGSFYKRHADVFRDDDARVVSLILYLNETDWSEGDGGQLRLYLGGEKKLDIQPQGGTLVCFLSRKLEHEVLVAHRDRMSFTGWFRKRI